MNALFIVVSGIAMIRRWRDPERRAYAEFLKQEGLKELLEDANEIFVIERVLFNEDDPYGKLPALVYEELDIDLDAVRSDCAARKERLIFTQQMHMRILKIRFGWNPPDQSSKTLTETRELTPGA
ncbi:MAG: hypothetical protein Q8P30_00870 [Candidatus Uhrbacteria bacterium]|nr:hypothetical protein [Candidatus Uhrbacteria bacterium]